MRQKIVALLEEALQTLRLRHFYCPDGIASITPPDGMQPYDRLLLVLSGRKNEPMSLGGRLRKVELGPGDAYLMSKNIWEYRSMTTPHRFLCIVPRGSYLRVSCYDVKADNPRSLWPPPVFHHTGQPYAAALDHVLTALKSADPDAASDLIRAALKLALAECRREDVPYRKALATFEKLKNHLDFNFAELITRENTAAAFKLSPSYVSGLFRAVAGQSFQDYLAECRIARAKLLLANTDLPVKAVAEACGFHGEVYFVRRFREIVGLPPGKYRAKEGLDSIHEEVTPTTAK